MITTRQIRSFLSLRERTGRFPSLTVLRMMEEALHKLISCSEQPVPVDEGLEELLLMLLNDEQQTVSWQEEFAEMIRCLQKRLGPIVKDERERQIRRFIGINRVHDRLWRKQFRALMDSVPPIPDALKEQDEEFPYLAFYDGRYTLADWLERAKIQYEENLDETVGSCDVRHQTPRDPFWFRATVDGHFPDGALWPPDVRAACTSNVFAGTVEIAAALGVQYPHLMPGYRPRWNIRVPECLNLAGSVYIPKNHRSMLIGFDPINDRGMYGSLQRIRDRSEGPNDGPFPNIVAFRMA